IRSACAWGMCGVAAACWCACPTASSCVSRRIPARTAWMRSHAEKAAAAVMLFPAPAVSDPRRGADVRARIALYAAAATVLFVLERLLPNPLPWVRLGLANAVTLLALCELGARPAAAVVALRVGLGSLFAGTLFGPQFALSASGAVASWAAMAAA